MTANRTWNGKSSLEEKRKLKHINKLCNLLILTGLFSPFIKFEMLS